MANDSAKFGVELDAKQVKREAAAAAKALGKLQKANEKINSKVAGAKANLANLKAQAKLEKQRMSSARKLAALQRKTDKVRASGRSPGRSGGRAGGGGFGASALNVFAGNMLTAAASKAVDLARAVAGASYEMVTFGQNSRFALGNLAKHGAQPEKLFEHARALAVRFGLDVMDTTDQYKKFLALQFNPRQTDKMIKMGADLQALGNSAEDVQGVFMALGQIKGKGRLQGEELLQLAERGVSTALVQEEIGKLLGSKSAAQVQKLQQAGKVTAEIGLEAIERAINRKLGQSELGQSGAKFAETTISGMIGRFRALGQDSGLKVVDRVAAPITKVLGSTLDKLLAFIESPKGAELIDKLAASLERMAVAGADLGGDLATKFIEADWKAIGASIVDIARGLVAAAKAGADLATTLGLGSGDAAGDSGGKRGRHADRASVAGFAAGGALAGAALGSVVPFVGTAAGAVVGGLAGAGLAAVENYGLDIGMSMADGLMETRVQSRADVAGRALGARAGQGARDELGIHSPSRVAMADGVQVARGLAIGMRRGARHVDRANYALADSITTDFSAVGPAMSSVGGTLLDARPSGGGSFTLNLNQVINGGGESAEVIGRIAARETRREIEGFFRQLALEV